MRLTDCVERYAEFREVRPATIQRLKFSIRRWEKLGCEMNAMAISVSDLDAFRIAARESLGPVSIETTVRDVRLLLKIVCGVILPVGRRLRIVLSPPSPPTTVEIDAVLRVCDQATYPITNGRAAAREWGTASDALAWRGFILIGLFTGLRLSEKICATNEPGNWSRSASGWNVCRWSLWPQSAGLSMRSPGELRRVP